MRPPPDGALTITPCGASGPDTLYNLDQGKRLTRRATIWRNTSEGWRILYHQGTIASAEEDDAFPVG